MTKFTGSERAAIAEEMYELQVSGSQFVKACPTCGGKRHKDHSFASIGAMYDVSSGLVATMIDEHRRQLRENEER